MGIHTWFSRPITADEKEELAYFIKANIDLHYDFHEIYRHKISSGEIVSIPGIDYDFDHTAYLKELLELKKNASEDIVSLSNEQFYEFTDACEEMYTLHNKTVYVDVDDYHDVFRGVNSDDVLTSVEQCVEYCAKHNIELSELQMSLLTSFFDKYQGIITFA